MKIHFTSYIILVLLAFTLGSCNIMDDSPCTDEPASAGTSVQVGFTLTAGEVSSRAITEGDAQGTGYENYIDIEGKDFRILLFDATENTYLTTFEPTIIRATDNSKYPQTYYVEGELPEAYSNFKLVVLANWGTYPTMSESSTIASVCTDAASVYNYNYTTESFTPSAENKIPMYGVKNCKDITLRADLLTDLGTVDLLRAMAKIDVKCSESLEDITLTGVTLHHYNTSGMCAPKGIYGNTTDWDVDTGTDCSHEIHLPENVTQGESLPFNKVGESYIIYVPEFDNKTTGVTKSYISVSMEHADKSPVTLENTNIYFGEYNTEGTLQPNTDFDIVRNHWYTYTINKVDDGKLIFQYRVKKWNVESSLIGWNVKFKIAAYNNESLGDGKNRRLSPDYDNATVGDDEATYCYLLYPRYDGKQHNGFDYAEDGGRSSYAGFSFQLTEPAGAVWKAYLREPNNGPYDNKPNFAFGTGQYDIDGDGQYDLFNVSTGIAREEPYQIQVKALNAWTDTDIDNPKNEEWGELVEQNGKEIYADLYITVSLDGVNEYELEINPKNVVNTTYWNNGRRFAGDDKYIRIWQLKATKAKDYDELITESNWSIYSTYWNKNTD